MTHEDWMALTNRPDVVEKDMVKLLDWFIKVQQQIFNDCGINYVLEISICWYFKAAVQRVLPRLGNRREIG